MLVVLAVVVSIVTVVVTDIVTLIVTLAVAVIVSLPPTGREWGILVLVLIFHPVQISER